MPRIRVTPCDPINSSTRRLCARRIVAFASLSSERSVGVREDPDAAQSITRAVGAANVAHPAEQSNLRSAPLENYVRPKQPEFSPPHRCALASCGFDSAFARVLPYLSAE